MFRIWKIKAESRLDALLARLKPSPLMARALPLSLLASLLIAEPAFAQANFEGLADNILGLLSNGLLRTLAIIAIIVVGLLWFLGRASVQMLVTVVVGVVIVFSAPWIVDTIDRKSTRLNPVTNAHLVCRLLLETKQQKVIDNNSNNKSEYR